MAVAVGESLADLYLEDETAWLEATAELVRSRDLANLDLEHLGEYLTDMAVRDRREVKSRLVVLLAHRLKWEFQRASRTRSWQKTMLIQRRKLRDVAGRGVLRTHADAVLPEAYADAVEQAAVETGLPRASFPALCPYTVAQLFEMDLVGSELS